MSRTAYIICAPSMGFPEGHAATARVTAYAKILMALDYPVTVLCPAASERDARAARNVKPRGEHQGISFLYPGGSTIRSRSFLVRRFRAAVSWARIAGAVLFRRPDVVLAYPMTPTIAALVLPVAKISRTLLVCDQSELPEIHAGSGPLAALRLRVKLWGMRHCDGIVAISPSIVGELRSRLPRQRVLLMPVVVDVADFPSAPTGDAPARRHIVYTGPMNDRKDGVGTLLEAFAEVRNARDDVRLVLLGEQRPEVVRDYAGRAAGLGIEEDVEFAGAVSRPRLLEELRAAAVLVLPRPDTPQNRANMPTKLVEYLASGRPIVATAVGHVPGMVTDGKEALLVEPGRPDALGRAVLDILSDPERAERMSELATALVAREFDFRSRVQVFAAFLADARSGGRRFSDE